MFRSSVARAGGEEMKEGGKERTEGEMAKKRSCKLFPARKWKMHFLVFVGPDFSVRTNPPHDPFSVSKHTAAAATGIEEASRASERSRN